MRTPRVFLGVFAFALIPPLLLLACGGSDEPADGSYQEPTTAASLMAQTSPETDREALIAFYNATGWKYNDNWLSDLPISQWLGVRTDHNGRVTNLYLTKWLSQNGIGLRSGIHRRSG